MSVHLLRDLENLHRSLLRMCTMVEELVHSAVNTLSEGNEEQALRLAKMDREIDECDVKIEEDCLKILALHQPVATDLRRITAVMKIASELERVGDLAVHVAERSTSVLKGGTLPIPSKMHTMADHAVTMIHESIDAYVNLDTAMARKVTRHDEIVDELHLENIKYITEIMHRDANLIDPALHLFSASRHLERVADHATNIAEDVLYLVEGEIVRHQDHDENKAAS